MKLHVKRVSPSATLPRYQTSGAAGLDLHLDLLGPGCSVTYDPHRWHTLSTGIAVQLPVGHEGQVRGRSGLAFREGVEFFVGTIDQDYRSEIRVLIKPTRSLQLRHGDRVAQLVVCPITRCEVVEAEQLEETGRGGFGSTGLEAKR